MMNENGNNKLNKKAVLNLVDNLIKVLKSIINAYRR